MGEVLEVFSLALMCLLSVVTSERHRYLELPYCAKVEDTLQPGYSFVIRGPVLNRDCNIRLTEGKSYDKVLLDVQFVLVQKILRVTAVNNMKIGKEMRFLSPFKADGPFNLRIGILHGRFRIIVGYLNLGDLTHPRGWPVSNDTHVHVNGTCHVSTAQWEPDRYTMPFNASMDGCPPGRRVFVRGVPTDANGRFEINFCTGEFFVDDMIFHFSVRFYEKTVVRNMWEKACWCWQEEERWGGFPFAVNKTVDMLFVCQKDKIQIYIDNAHFVDFVHRGPPSKIKSFTLENQFELHDFYIE